MGSVDAQLRFGHSWLREWHELVDPVPEPSPPLNRPTRLCVGMATYDDFDGVWFTVASMLLHHPEVSDQISFVIIDNHPTSAVSQALKELEVRFPRLRYVPFRAYKGTAVRDLVFREAQAEIVMCVDSHVMLAPGALAAAIAYFDQRPDSPDLVQGPLISGRDMTGRSTHFDPEWGAGMFGRWGRMDTGDEPYELQMQGLGVFACRKDAWPGFSPLLRGFGCEEGYLHEKVRRGGGRTVGLPALAWMHRFQRPRGTDYPNVLADRLRNYELAWAELGWDMTQGRAHFVERGLSPSDLQTARRAVDHPLTCLDAIMVLNDDRDRADWARIQSVLIDLDIGWRAERVSTGEGLSREEAVQVGLRRAVVDAQRRGLANVMCIWPGADLDRRTLDRLPSLLTESVHHGDGFTVVPREMFDEIVGHDPTGASR